MEFISNLIKRPISLVINESSNSIDKIPTAETSSPSLPSNIDNIMDNSRVLTKSASEEREINHNNKNCLTNMSSSCHAGNISDFIGVPEGYLGEFEDIPPPSPLLGIEFMRSLSITPPPPPPLSEEETLPLPPAMKASQTIDELLSQINDNLQEAGLNDDIMAITTSSNNKSELNNLSGKAVLNNTKLSTPPAKNSLNSDSKTASSTHKTPTTAAGSAVTVFENNSSLNKFHIDPELENALCGDGDLQQEQHQLENQSQHVTNNKDLMNNSGVNNPSNKFVGLTAFDETKIPELPGVELNSNIEDQYNVTFEECFIPTLTAQQEIKRPQEFAVDRTHLLLPTETNTHSSDNETFEDCNDEKDPLSATFAESNDLYATTELDSYRSAVNIMNGTHHNDTMDNIADITLEADALSLQTQVVTERQNQQSEVGTQQDEPMDVDMNGTMEIIQQTSNNIQQVEKVLQHAENVLQHIEEKKPVEDDIKGENFSVEEKSSNENTQIEEISQAKNEVALNEINELSSKSNNLGSEPSTETNGDNADSKEKNNELQTSTTEVKNNNNLSINSMNSSMISNSSSKTTADVKGEANMNLTVNLDNSIISQKSSAPNSPSFPIKPTQNEGFPRSPKSWVNKQPQSPFLEKANYTNGNTWNFNGNFEKPSTDSKQLNGTFVESTVSENSIEQNSNDQSTVSENSIEQNSNDNKKQFHADTLNQELETNVNEFKSPTQFPAAVDKSVDNRRTFCVNETANESETPSTTEINHDDQTQVSPESNTQFPSAVDQPIDKRRTFCTNETATNFNTTATRINETCTVDNEKPQTIGTEPRVSQESVDDTATIQENTVSRRTFNVAANEKVTEQNAMNTSFEPMDVDDTPSANTTMHHNKNEQPQPLAKSVEQQRDQSPTLPTIEQRSQSPAVPAHQPRSDSPPLPAMQQKSQTPPLPAVAQTSQSTYEQERSQSPPLPTMQQRSQSPPLPAMQHQTPSIRPIELSKLQEKAVNIKKEQISPTTENDAPSTPPFNPKSQPLPTLIQKRPPIRNISVRPEILSAKEQNNIKFKDEKDVFVEKCTPSPIENVFTGVSPTSTTVSATASGFSEFDRTSSSSSSPSLMISNGEQQNFDEEFSGNNNIILKPSDFDYLLTKGYNDNTQHVDRSSLLLKFDPLLGVPVIQERQEKQQQLKLQLPTNTNPCLSPTLEEDEHNHSNRSFVIEKPTINGGDIAAAGAVDDVDDVVTGTSAKLIRDRLQAGKQFQLKLGPLVAQQNKRQLAQGVNKKNATMSVDVIKDMSLDNDCNKTFENSNSTQSDDKQNNYKMDELEKKIKNEVLKTEDIEKKLKDAEQREEALIKRITEKDKTVAKMTGVIEAYEKAIAELIAEKEQLIQNYEKQLAEVKADRDSNYHHLTSLETTFSDLHVKYEKSKEMTCQLKASEEALQAEKRKNLENLHLQEQRYEKMKNHAIQQLEIANKKLESLTRDHSIETTKLKALLKKEEIARSSITEQLTQKTRENAELVKICDELIANQGS